MKIVPLGAAGLALVASGLFGFSTLVHAQDSTPPPVNSRALSATVDYGNGNVFQPTKSNSAFQCLGLDPGQFLAITVQFPTDLAGQPMIVEPLDGGLLTVPEGGFFVDTNGNVTFQFQAIDLTGLCRIGVHQPDDSNFVQLWVVDPDHSESTPPDLAGLY
jgi:hypothetical protein